MKNKLKKILHRKISLFMNRVTGSGLAQDENSVDGKRYITPGMPDLVRHTAEEGIVLLKNEGHTLPVLPGQTVSVFGRTQHDWFYVGYGSGGDVHPPYEISLFQGLDNAGIRYYRPLKARYDTWTSLPGNQAEHGYWGHWPYCHEEMPLEPAVVEDAKAHSDTALIIIGRAAGEDRENKLEEGSYYLTRKERDMLSLVTKTFDKTILLMDCGNIIDMSFLDDYKISAVLFAWQLGQENANAVADVLSGKTNPSGKLSDTIAKTYEDYPSSANFGGKPFNCYVEDIYVGYRFFTTFAENRVRFPFGFGLSYTTFSLTEEDASITGSELRFDIKVTNTGAFPGKEVVQVYVSAPNGKLGKAKKSLVGYCKTPLLQPGDSKTVRITAYESDFSSFDDAGLTGFKDCFVLEQGRYTFYAGTDCTANHIVLTYDIPETKIVRQCAEACIPNQPFLVLNPLGSQRTTVSRLPLPARPAASGSRNLRTRVLEHLPTEIPPTGDQGILLSDVKAGKSSLDEFIAQLPDTDLASLSRGEGAMNSSLGTPGNAGAFGGITPSLRKKGIPPVITADGPTGLRVKRYTTLLPCGTAIACTWNTELIEQCFRKVGEEAAHFGIDVILAPGMNIHRDPLCGRNFEYFSEDPLLSGKTAAAAVRGLQSGGVSACPKHFACNNQEFNRNYNDSRVSMRALREIYLKNFEYCVKESWPQNLMTSYNKVNGVWSHYNYDLATTVLREEWGFKGNILTDWWMRGDSMPEFPAIANNAYRSRAQVDVLMPGNMSALRKKFSPDKSHLISLGSPDGLTRAELQRTAKNVLRFVLTRMP